MLESDVVGGVNRVEVDVSVCPDVAVIVIGSYGAERRAVVFGYVHCFVTVVTRGRVNIPSVIVVVPILGGPVPAVVLLRVLKSAEIWELCYGDVGAK